MERGVFRGRCVWRVGGEHALTVITPKPLKKSLRECPGCGVPIQKIDGCDSMVWLVIAVGCRDPPCCVFRYADGITTAGIAKVDAGSPSCGVKLKCTKSRFVVIDSVVPGFVLKSFLFFNPCCRRQRLSRSTYRPWMQ